jgi:hypothetical protein
VKELVGEPAAPSVLAQALALWAVALLRQGQERQARWRLAEAASFAPAAARETLQGFADALQAMEGWFASLDREQNLDRYTELPASHKPPKPVQLQPLPTMASSLAPELLAPARVLLRVSAEGVPEAPVLLQSSGDVSFDWALMESLRGWVFAPASQEGRPVTGYYLVTATIRGQTP